MAGLFELPHTFSVGKKGEEPTHTGLLGNESHREARRLSQGSPFSVVTKTAEDGTGSELWFGGSKRMF